MSQCTVQKTKVNRSVYLITHICSGLDCVKRIYSPPYVLWHCT